MALRERFSVEWISMRQRNSSRELDCSGSRLPTIFVANTKKMARILAEVPILASPEAAGKLSNGKANCLKR
jgi:hypothetical protein